MADLCLLVSGTIALLQPPDVDHTQVHGRNDEQWAQTCEFRRVLQVSLTSMTDCYNTN
jgi:hypothetical protein